MAHGRHDVHGHLHRRLRRREAQGRHAHRAAQRHRAQQQRARHHQQPRRDPEEAGPRRSTTAGSTRSRTRCTCTPGASSSATASSPAPLTSSSATRRRCSRTASSSRGGPWTTSRTGARPEALPRPLQDPLVPGPTLEGVLAPRHHGEHHRRLHQARGLHALERRLRHQDALLRRVQQPRPRRRHQQEGHLAWVPRHRPEGRRAVHRRAVHRRRVVAQVHRHAAHPRVQVLKTACMAWYIQHTLGRWYIHVCT
ncbi:Pectinesterase 5 [Zea mays]|uniref:Pectinesterase 5 n=2 Tax=Zea mays TaxID=4577 RepID=A0A1D6E974_MAIZE|nr:Pectinesterase 5 [Zea mays]